MWILLRTWKGGGGLQGELSRRELLWSLNWSRCQVLRPWGQTAWLHILPSPLWVVWFGAGFLISLNLRVPPGERGWSNTEICLDTENPYWIHELTQSQLTAGGGGKHLTPASAFVAGVLLPRTGPNCSGRWHAASPPGRKPRENRGSKRHVQCAPVFAAAQFTRPGHGKTSVSLHRWTDKGDMGGVCVCVVYIFVYICVCMYIHTQWNIT